MPPAVAEATRASLKIVKSDHWRRLHLHKLIQRFRSGAQQLGLQLMDSRTPIQALIIGDSLKASRISKQLLDNDILISAIRPPTVPEGSARLRITLSALHKEAHIDQLLDTLAEVFIDSGILIPRST